MIKTLTINGTDFAKYQIEHETLYLKILRCFKGYRLEAMEHNLVFLIAAVEGVAPFKQSGYLNI